MEDPFADIPIVGKGQAGSVPTAPSNDIPIGPNGEPLDLPPNTGATNTYGGIPSTQTSKTKAPAEEDPFADIPMVGKATLSATPNPKIELEKDNPFGDIPMSGKVPSELPWYKNLPLSAVAQTAAGAIQTAGGFERAGAAPVTDISGVNAPFQRGATTKEATTAFDNAIADKQAALDSIQGIVKKRGFSTADFDTRINNLQQEIGKLEEQKQQTLQLPQYTSDTQQQELIQQRQQLGKEATALSEQAAGMFPALGVSQKDTSIAAQLGRGIGGVIGLAPAFVTGPLALPAMVAMGGSQAYGEGYDSKVQELKQQGVTDQKQLDEAGHEAGSQAAIKQVPALAAYTIGGSLTTAATSALLKGASPLVKGLVGGTAASGVNLGVSGGLRKAEGGNFLPSVEQAVPDILFGGLHGLGAGLEARAEAKKAADAELGGPAPEVAPSSNPLVNEKEAQITSNADVLHEVPAPVINIPAATPEELAKAGETPITPATETPLDNTQKLIDLATDQLEHKEGSPKHTAIQAQIDELNKPAEAPVAEAQPETPNAIQVENAGEVGIRNAPTVGEGVGRQNEAEVPAQEGEAPKEKIEGTSDIAQRIVNAEERFISYAQEQGGLTREEAIKALNAYKKGKAIKIDSVGGEFKFTHGDFANRDILRIAAGLKEAAPKEEVGPEAAATTQVQAKEEPPKEEKITPEPTLDQMAKHDLAYVDPQSLKLSEDVPNFKEGADPITGVVAGEELKGKYDPEAAGIVHIWERLNGDREVISGRHRWQLALANRIPEILIKIHKESNGFTKEDALVKDAQLNIKDEKGSVKDFAAYFRNDKITKEDAQQGGLLSRSKQKNGFSIGRYSEDDLYGLFRAGKISEAKAAAIAESAPNDPALQRAAIGASKGLTAEEIPGYIALLKEKSKGSEEQTNLFGEDESFIKEAMRISKAASARSNELSEQIRAVQGAARNPEAAAKLGVDVKDPQGLQKRIADLKEQREKYAKFWLHDEIKEELGIKKPNFPTIETTGEGNLFGEKEMPFSLAGEMESAPAETEPIREDKLTGSFDFGELSSQGLESWADNTIKESKKRLNVGLDPEVLTAYAVKGAFKIARGVKDFTAWSKEMLSEFGEAIRPHLDDLWNRANQIHEKDQASKYGPKPPSERDAYAERLTNQLTKVLGRPPTAEEVSRQVDKKFGKAEEPVPATAPIAGGEGEKISLKNESAEAETKALGLPELTQQDEQEMNAAMDRAKTTSTEDPMAGQRLAESLIADPRRSLTGDESALLLKHKTDLFNSLNKMSEGLTEGSPEQKFEKGLAYDNASKAYHDLLQAIKDRGSEWGREGRWRQALLHQDYTFATQERLATSAKRKPLTSKEKTKLAEETKRLNDIDKQIAENQEKEANKQEQKGLEKELKSATKVDPYIQSLVDRVKKNVKSLADKYREELKQEAREGRLFTGVDPTKLHKFAVIGADHLLEGTTKFADWSSKMIGDFGEKIRPYLDDIFKKSKEFNEQQIDKESKGSKSVKKRIVKASSPEERIRKGQETRARNRLEQLKQEEERQNKGDFSKPLKKAPIEASEETKRLRIEAQKIKDRIDKRKADFEKANRPFVNKVLDAISALNRFNILSHITVLEHLAGAAVENIVTRPVSSTLAQLFRFNKTLNAIRNKAVYEGGLSAKSELKGVFGIATSAKDVWSKVLKGKADIDWLYGGKNNNSPSFVRAVENIHGAMKEPIRQGIFSRSLQLRIEAAEKQGLDPTHDEVLYHALASEAVNDANSDIFMGDNFITRGIRGLIKGYETNKQSPRLGKFVSTLLDIAMPIMNVPTNIAIRKMRLGLGLLETPIRIGIAAKEGKLANGAETLTTQEAEQIMRAFKYGTLGLVVGAYAWTHSNQFGGIINNVGPNAPENKDLKKGEMQLGGIKISRPLGHGAVATFMNMVADARRMYDKSVRNNPNNKWSSLSEPAFFSMFVSGLGSMPPAQAATRFFSPFTTAGQKLGQTVRDMIIPGAVQDVAAKMDTTSQPKNFIDMLESEPIKRSPKTFEQEIMKGIPGLRNQLPTPKGRSSRSSSILPSFTESNNSTFGSFKD